MHGGRTVATAEGRIVDADGKLYAHGTSTLLIFGELTAPPRAVGTGGRAMRHARACR